MQDIIGLILSVMLLSMILSCQNPKSEHQRSLSGIDTTAYSPDTSSWLKATRGIRDILEDSKGNLWFSSPDYVAKFDGKSMQYFTEKEGLNIVGNLHQDASGTIWVEDGFKIFRHNDDRFIEENWDNISVSTDFWFQRGLNPTDTSYVEPGLYHLSSKDINFFPYPIQKDVNNKYLYFPTTKAYVGMDGTVWMGTMEKVFGLKNGSFISIGREEMGRQNDERQMGIRGIFVDSKGMLWMADNGAGIFTYDGREVVNFTLQHHLDEGEAEGSTLHRAFSIGEDTLGNMWFGTVYSGIWRYNPQTGELTNYTEEDGVRSENIWTIYSTKDGELLFAGESPGAVYQFNGKTFDRIY